MVIGIPSTLRCWVYMRIYNLVLTDQVIYVFQLGISFRTGPDGPVRNAGPIQPGPDGPGCIYTPLTWCVVITVGPDGPTVMVCLFKSNNMYLVLTDQVHVFFEMSTHTGPDGPVCVYTWS